MNDTNDINNGDIDEIIDEIIEEIVEGCWECPVDPILHKHLNPVINKGIDKSCCECGKERPRNVEFYLPEDHENHQRFDEAGNPDWLCVACNNYNEDEEIICTHCMAHREDKYQPGENLQEGKEEIVYDALFTPKPSKKYPDNLDYSNNVKNKYSPKKSISTISKYFIILLPIVTLLLICIYFMFFNIAKINLKIVDLKWKTQTDIFDDVIKYDDGFNLPNYAIVINQEEKIKNYYKKNFGKKQKIIYIDKTISDGFEKVKESRKVKNGFKNEKVKVKNGVKQVKIGFKRKSIGNGKFKKTYLYKSVQQFKIVSKKVQQYKLEYYYIKVPKTKDIKLPKTIIVDDIRDMPIYATYYYWKYTIRQKVNTVYNIGSKKDVIVYKKPKNGFTNPSYITDNISYFIIFENENKKRYKYSVSNLDNYEIGAKYIAKINNLGILEIVNNLAHSSEGNH